MQQVGSESAEFLQLHNRHPDLSSSFILAHHELESGYYYWSYYCLLLLQLLPLLRSLSLLILLLLLLSLREELSGLCSACHTVSTLENGATLSELLWYRSTLLQSISDCQNWSTACHTVSKAAHHTLSTFNNPLSTLGQHIALCQHWHGAKASVNNGTGQYLLSILAQRKSLCQ